MAANPFNITKQGSVASRFVSSSELSDAQKKKEDDLKAAYARIGQEPPPRPEKDEYDPRSLFEVGAASMHCSVVRIHASSPKLTCPSALTPNAAPASPQERKAGEVRRDVEAQ